MSVQTNFRAVDMLGGAKPVEGVAAKPAAPKAKAPKNGNVESIFPFLVV